MKIDIEFFGFKKLTFSLDEIRTHITQLISDEKKNISKIYFYSINREKMFEMNKKYLNHDTDTDIITFEYKEDDSISGECFISSYAVINNAKEYLETVDRETIRLFFHGVLHLCGYADNTEYDKKTMALKEDSNLEMFHVKQNKQCT